MTKIDIFIYPGRGAGKFSSLRVAVEVSRVPHLGESMELSLEDKIDSVAAYKVIAVRHREAGNGADALLYVVEHDFLLEAKANAAVTTTQDRLGSM